MCLDLKETGWFVNTQNSCTNKWSSFRIQRGSCFFSTTPFGPARLARWTIHGCRTVFFTRPQWLFPMFTMALEFFLKMEQIQTHEELLEAWAVTTGIGGKTWGNAIGKNGVNPEKGGASLYTLGIYIYMYISLSLSLHIYIYGRFKAFLYVYFYAKKLVHIWIFFQMGGSTSNSRRILGCENLGSQDASVGSGG